MSCRGIPVRSFRLVTTAVLAGGLALAACTSNLDTPPGDEPPVDEVPDTATNDTPEPGEPEPSAPSDPAPVSDEDAVAASYQGFLEALVAAMAAADPDFPELAEQAEGPGLLNAQAMVLGLVEAGRYADGELTPSIQSIELDTDTAELADCYRLDLVEYDRDTGEQVADRGGARFEASAELRRDPDGWIVTDFVEGDVCAPVEIATEVADRYLAHWDALWDAADPPDPDHPGLDGTAAGEHLAGLQAELTRLREAGQVRRGRGVEHPVVVAVTAHDTQAMVRDCIEEDPDSGVYDATTGELIAGGTAPGQRTLLETRLEQLDGTWRVVNVRVAEEESGCEPGEE